MRCPLPHCTTEELRRSRPQRILLPRILLQRIRLPSLGSSCTARRSLRRAVRRNPNSVPPSSLLVAARGSGAAPLQHAMHTARSSAVAARSTLSAPSSQPASSPPCTAHPAPHNPGDTSPVMSLPDCGAPHEHIPPSTLVLYQCRFLSTHVVHPPQAIVMAATATHHTLPILVHCNALLHTATPQCRLPTTRLGVPQLRRCGPCRI